LAGNGVVFDSSRVTWPSQPGSNGVTLATIPHLAYEDFPSATTMVSSGMRRYSTDLVSTKLLGGMMQMSSFDSTRLRVSKFLGSTTVLKALTKMRHSGAARRSYPKLDRP